jgi:hypothetical protein
MASKLATGTADLSADSESGMHLRGETNVTALTLVAQTIPIAVAIFVQKPGWLHDLATMSYFSSVGFLITASLLVVDLETASLLADMFGQI